MTSEPHSESAVTLSNGARVESASPAARAIARFVDSVVHAVLGVGGSMLVFLATFCVWCSTHETNSGQAALGVLALIAWVLYEPVMVAWRGQTLGKLMTRVKIVRVADGEPPRLWQAIVRWAIPAAAGVALSLVVALVLAGVQADAMRLLAMFAAWAPLYLTSFMDDDGRGWHDMAAGTIVVSVDAAPHEQRCHPPTANDAPQTPSQKSQQAEQAWGLVSDYYATPSESPPSRDSRD